MSVPGISLEPLRGQVVAAGSLLACVTGRPHASAGMHDRDDDEHRGYQDNCRNGDDDHADEMNEQYAEDHH